MVEREVRFNVRRALAISLFTIVIIALVLVLFAREDLYGMLRALGNANYGFVILAVAVYLISTLFWTARWRMALSVADHAVSPRDLYLVICGGIFINNVTPLTRPTGDPFARAYLLNKTTGVPYSSGFATIVSEYMLDLPVFVSFLALGLLMSIRAASIWPALTIVGIWIVVVILLVLLFLRFLRKRVGASRIGSITIHILKWLRRRVSKVRIKGGVEGFYAGAHAIVGRWRSALCMVAFSAVLWALAVARLFLVFQALGYDPSLPMLLVASTLPSVAGLVPFLPGGLGIVDATFIGIFLGFGVPPALALSATLIERAISLVFSTGVGAIALSYLGVRVWAK